MSDPMPTRLQVHTWLKDLASGKVTPEEADEWATPWVVEDRPAWPFDPVVWHGLTHLCGADLKTSPDQYLHCQENFDDWVRQFEVAVEEEARQTGESG